MGGCLSERVASGRRPTCRPLPTEPVRSEVTTVPEMSGTPGVIRTPDPLLRRQVLYPAELRAHMTWKTVHYNQVIVLHGCDRVSILRAEGQSTTFCLVP